MKRGSVLNTRGKLTTGRRPRAREHHKAAIRELLVTPVLVDVSDLDAAEEARLIIAATGRESVPGEAASMLYSDREARHMQRINDAMAEQITAGQSLAIAEQIGHYDRPFVAVSGVQGGVGTSTLAVHLAAVLAQSVDPDEVLVVDADSHSVGLDLLNGWEQVPGQRINRSDGNVASTPGSGWLRAPGGAHLQVVSQTGSAGRTDSGVSTFGEVSTTISSLISTRAGTVPIVVDCGRCLPWDANWSQLFPTIVPDLLILVGGASVAGAQALMRAADACEAAELPVVAVLRSVDPNQPIPTVLYQLLGDHPSIEWAWDERIAREPLEGFSGEPSATDYEFVHQLLQHLPAVGLR